MSQNRADETSMNLISILILNLIDSGTEPTFSNISKLEPYCFQAKKSNVGIEDSSKSEEEPMENLTQGIGNKDWCSCGNSEQQRHPKKVSAVRIKKEFRKNILKVMAPYQTKSSK